MPYCHICPIEEGELRVTKLSKKVSLLGDFSVGKTSLVRRFVHDRFENKYISTIGVKVSRKTVAVPQADDVINLTLMLWDLAGNETFDHVRATYLRGSAGAVLVCDLTRPETLDSLRGYAQDLRKANPVAQFVLAANKYDLTSQRQLTQTQLEAMAAELDTLYYLTSAKTGDEVEILFRQLGQRLVGGP